MFRKPALMLAMALGVAAGSLAIPQRAAADPVPPFIPADAHWLDTVNYYRSMASIGMTSGVLSPVLEVPSWNTGAYNHSCYMLYNGIAHDELGTRPGYTASGDQAGNNGNVAVSTTYNTSSRNHIELWMTGPFHAIGILRHQLRQVGFGKCDLPSTSTGWRSAATLDILTDLQWRSANPRPSQPVLFPGNGTTTNLSAFITESPNPLNFCGITGGAGLPVIAMMPEPVTAVSASMSGPNGAVSVCPLFSGNINSGGTANERSSARAILAYDNAVTVVPRTVLSPGVYTVTVNTQARSITWSFTVDPTAATGIMPIPEVQPSGPISAYTDVTPYRFADSRPAPDNKRITVLLAKTVKKVKVAETSTGTFLLPDDITAISANITVVGPAGNGYLTVYNCSSPMPLAAAINYSYGKTVGNAGVFPLSSDGSICLYSPASTHVVIDINGYFRNDSASSYHPVEPTPLVDTTTNLNSDGRLAAGDTLQVNVPDADIGVPNDATAVAIIVSGEYPSAPGYITVFPCGTMPGVSTLNPVPGTVRTNSAIVPLSANGDLCLYTVAPIHVTIDVVGYFQAGGTTGRITPTTPTRVTDTREVYRPEMNFDNDGLLLQANTTYALDLGGERNIPGSAKAVSMNVTVVTPGSTGTLRVTPCGTSPNVYSLSYMQTFTVNTGMQVKLSSAGEVCIRATSNVHVVMDVTGYWN